MPLKKTDQVNPTILGWNAWCNIKLKLVTLVKSDQKALFSVATTPRCREGATPFFGLLRLPLINTL